jgi:hypothetical protein
MNRLVTLLRAKWLITLLGCAGVLGCSDILGFQEGHPYPPDTGTETTDAGALDSGDAESSSDAGWGQPDVNRDSGMDGSPSCTAGTGMNDICKCVPDATQPCQTHPGADGKGPCQAGHQTCILSANKSSSDWGPCTGSVPPAATDLCTTKGDDSNCNGVPNDGCPCVEGDAQPCGPDNPQGICKKGMTHCQNQHWGACDAIFPKTRDCTSSADNDCDGKPDSTIDTTCQCNSANGTQACGTHPQDGVGTCKAGSQTCIVSADKTTASWSACTGSVGPMARSCTTTSDNDCNGTPDNIDIHGSMTFEYVGHEVMFQVPPCATKIEVDASGAQGGDYDSHSVGGRGGRVQATITVQVSQLLYIFVGGAGPSCPEDQSAATAPGGFNGGGATICGNTNAAGGGATDIRLSPLLSDRILVAGGGGGAGAGSLPMYCPMGGNGGPGGGTIGGDASVCTDSTSQTNMGGRGGTQLAGGIGGLASGGRMGEAGKFGAGGAGAEFCTGPGGGGGGWWGGGGGDCVGGGGGGSSFVSSTAGSNIVHTQGFKSGNGQVTIRW